MMPKKWHIKKFIEYNNNSINIMMVETEGFCEAVEKAESKFGKHEEAEKISTIFGFINLTLIDILTLWNMFMLAKNDNEKKLISKTACHHMYEFIKDGEKIFGVELKTYNQIFKNADIENEINELRRLFNSVKKRNETFLKEVRHNVSGHKDRNIRKQFAVIKSIDIEKFDVIFFDFMCIVMPYTDLKKKIKYRKRPI
ncbi:hypothetical protein U3A58_08380 [Algoriphagus sp. C2-6-M1]|uniref:hypothetical protein n=1 Tax=Algoriphagus persicinus TaxID=3108754 RepID=UPI002B3C6EF9|nr:hypothetical protein [Algoriphagus sp. C2-6-M1]MEB2780409.1 hypothetical protein [Algoriphagus sp. C2-6-M1]